MSLKSRKEAIKNREIKLYQIPEEEKRKISNIIKSELEEEDRIAFAYLFGSFIENAYFRDIDIAVFVENFKESDWYYYEITLLDKVEKK
ncbi:nucleotidyltransferase domain-containing protein [Thermodesulfovibrio sp. 3907-1M]|uniref:Nucleotidyltransferase domain-containing protein n=1 Tax=Thermodesulfovibrio autotrophicus TaxID=3118333 RepID=A0AAU8GUF9_9BACT